MSDFTKSKLLALGASSLAATSAYALTSTFNISVAFAQPFTIVETQKMTFGTVIASTTANYNLNTTDVLTATGAGALVAGTPKTGDYTITDTGTANNNIDISIGTFTANNGVTPSSPLCDWNGQGPVAGCVLTNVSGAAGGKVLNVGMTIHTDGTQANGTSAHPTFTISVVYD